MQPSKYFAIDKSMDTPNYTVLYIEDDNNTRKNIAEYLNYKFENVIEGNDGQIAYELYNKHKPDFIITDINLPNMSGLEVIRKIRNIDSNIPIIAMSAHSEKEKLLSAIKLNLIEYLIKPVDRADLNNALDKAVEKLKVQNNSFMYDDFMEAILILDNEYTVKYLNKECLKIFGYKDDNEMIGKSVYSITLKSDKNRIQEALQSDTNVNHKIHLVRKDGTEFLARTHAKNSIINNSIVRVISIIDMSDSVEHCALDTLTSLKTRSVLDLEYNNLMQNCKRNGESAGAIFVDIDNFKLINDSMGHQFGDEAIKSIANILVLGVRKSDVVIRWGGDEFLILLFNISLSSMQKMAENLRSEINNMNINGHDSFTCSFGIDMIKKDDTLAQVIHRIDKALIRAKRNSKNIVIQYSEL